MVSSLIANLDALAANSASVGAWDGVRLALLWGCWGIVGLVWLAGAVYNIYRAPAVRQRGEWMGQWIAGGAIVVFALLFVPHAIWTQVTYNALWLWLLGAVCLILSTAFTLWARGVLGTMWSSVAVTKEGHELRTTGPYAVTRHPIYTGLLGMLLGTMLLSGLGPSLAYFLAGLVVVEIKIATEEKLLGATFGPRYTAYKRSVPQLIPGLHWLTGALRWPVRAA
jgi:protein-S-isoprenylcysteine O-methyltransferase Ste14